MQSSAAKQANSYGPRPGTSVDKPPLECTQESTGSSQADTSAQPDADMLKVKKCERKARSMCDLRATRRSNPAKPPQDKAAATQATPAAQQGAGAATPGAPGSRVTSAGLPEPAVAPAATAPPAQPAYPMPQMQQQNMLPYNPQVRPHPPLNNCCGALLNRRCHGSIHMFSVC